MKKYLKPLIKWLVFILFLIPIYLWLRFPDSELKDIYKFLFIEEPIVYAIGAIIGPIALILREELLNEFNSIWRLKKKEEEEDRQYKLRKQKQQEEQAKRQANEEKNQSRELND